MAYLIARGPHQSLSAMACGLCRGLVPVAKWQSIADQTVDETVAGESAELLGTASGTVSSRSDKKPSLELLSAVRAVGPQAIG